MECVDKEPDKNTIWDFKEAISNNEIERELFNLFNNLDFDARWVKKGSESFFGYKDHVKCDQERKIITDFSVTDASVHDVQEPEDLVNKDDNTLDLDAGYFGKDRIAELLEKYPNLGINICARAYRNKPITEEEKALNTAISRRSLLLKTIP